MSEREEPASPEEAANRLAEIQARWSHPALADTLNHVEREDVAYLLAEVKRLSAPRADADLAVTGVMERLTAETREQATRLEAAYRDLDEARARLDAIRLASRAPLHEDLVTAVQGLAAVFDEHSRCRDLLGLRPEEDPVAAVAALVERDEATIRTRADVEARLAGADHQWVVNRFRAVKLVLWGGGSITTGEGGALLVDLVCAVLGVPHAG